jgi:hypothetical protein
MSKLKLIGSLTEVLFGESTVQLPVPAAAFSADGKAMQAAIGDKMWPAVVPHLKEIPGMTNENKKLDKEKWTIFFPAYQAALAAEELPAELSEQAFKFASGLMSAEAAVNPEFAAAVTGLSQESQTYEGWAGLVNAWLTPTNENAAEEVATEVPAETLAETVETANEELGTEAVEETATEAVAEAATEIAATLTEEEKVEIIEAATEQSGVVPASADEALVLLMGGTQQILALMEAQTKAVAKTSQVVTEIAQSLATLSDSNTTVLTAMSDFLGKANTNLQGALQARLAPTVEVPQLEA